MQRQITFAPDSDCNFTGRNGYFKCSGIDLLSLTNGDSRVVKVMLTPLTSRGDLARCDVTIPVENINEVIKALEEIRDAEVQDA